MGESLSMNMCFFEKEMSLVIFWSIPIDIPANKIIRQFHSNCRRHLRPYYVSLISVFSCRISTLCWRLKIFPLLVKLINLKLWQIKIINNCICFYSFHQDFSPVFIIMVILMFILLMIQKNVFLYYCFILQQLKNILLLNYLICCKFLYLVSNLQQQTQLCSIQFL